MSVCVIGGRGRVGDGSVCCLCGVCVAPDGTRAPIVRAGCGGWRIMVWFRRMREAVYSTRLTVELAIG